MKTIYLVRHAKSSWENLSIDDHDRTLNARGKRDAPLMAKVLYGKGVQLDAVISSSAKRARKTAEAFMKAYKIPVGKLIIRPDLYHAYPETIEKIIRKLPDEYQTVALFGHNPGYTLQANRFGGPYIDNVPTTGIIGASCDVSSWKKWNSLEAKRLAFYYPKQFT